MFAKVFTNSSAPSLLRQQAKREIPYFVSEYIFNLECDEKNKEKQLRVKLFNLETNFSEQW